jgi:NTE family protein
MGLFGKSSPQKVALVLASGGARGLAHIGVIRELEENGFEISSIAGSSIGSLVGGIYASGKLDAFTEWVCDLDQVDVLDLMDFTLTGRGFIKGDRLFEILKGFLSESDISKLPIPYAAVAADLLTRREVVFRTGSLAEAIRASVAIPTVITPVIRKNMVLVDGGVVSPIPADVVLRTKGDILVVSDINVNKPYVAPEVRPRPVKEHEYSIKRKLFDLIREHSNYFSTLGDPSRPPGYLDVIDKTFDIMQDSICNLTKQNYKPEISVEISRESASTFEFHRAEELIITGRLAFLEALESYRNKDKY